MKNGLSLREKQVLVELSKNARLSDRELAARLKTSQPTVTRIRSKLLAESFVDRFAIIPNLEKLGLRFHALTFVKSPLPSVSKKMGQWAHDQSCVLFAAEGEGLQHHTVVMESLHPDYSEYTRFLRQFREKFPGQGDGLSSFLVDAQDIFKFYHWDKLVAARVDHVSRTGMERISRREKLGKALGSISEKVSRIPNPLKKEKEVPK